MERPDDWLERALAENREGQPMVIVGLRIGQQAQQISQDMRANGSIMACDPSEEAAQSLIRGLEMTTCYSQAEGQIVWKPDQQYRVVSNCGDQQAELEILSSLLSMIDEGRSKGNEESVARHIWDLAPDESYLRSVED